MMLYNIFVLYNMLNVFHVVSVKIEKYYITLLYNMLQTRPHL